MFILILNDLYKNYYYIILYYLTFRKRNLTYKSKCRSKSNKLFRKKHKTNKTKKKLKQTKQRKKIYIKDGTPDRCNSSDDICLPESGKCFNLYTGYTRDVSTDFCPGY